ncbi:MAG: hypothetical protein ACM3OG_08880 [Actinomycetota bacterium]
MRGSLRKLALPLLLFLYVACLFGATASLQDGLFERDGYYHARFARMMPERGLSRHFPWTQISTWKDRFCDKEFLYHLAMMPFAQIGEEPIFGARLFACLLSVAVVVTLFCVLRANRARWPAFFAALPLAMGGLFIARLGMIRSHVLSMLLLLLGVHFLLGRKWRALFVLGFVYAWSYTVPFVLLITAAPFVVGRWLGRGGLDWRSVAAAGAGSTLGLALHPYTPITLESILTYMQVFRLGLEGVASSGFELGNEIYPYPLPVFFNIYPLVVITQPLLAALAVGWRRRLAPETAGAVLASLLWFGMTMASARFVEYSVLLLAVALALLIRDACAAESGLPARILRNRRARLAVLAGALGTLVCFHVYSMTFYVVYQTEAAPPRRFQGASVWMARHLAPRETVINLFWDDFPDLFYDAPRQYYLWGLDPTYTIRYDRETAIDLERMRQGKKPLNGRAMKALFASRYLILRTSRAVRFPELRVPPFTEVFRDGSAVLFRID